MKIKTPFDVKYMRYLLESNSNKKFLRSLFEAKSAKVAGDIIQKCDSRQINTLIKVLCLQIQGAIPLLKDDAEKLAPSHRKKLREKFAKNSSTSEFIKKHLSDKKAFLASIGSSYSILLRALFVKDYRDQYE